MSWPNLRHYSDIGVEGLKENREDLNRDIRSPGRDFNAGPPEYEAGVLTIRLRRSLLWDKLNIVVSM
jgi:hypothetical protein